MPVLAGTGSNSTQEAIELTLSAEKIGADGALLITPYYNKPTQEGLYRHFETVAKETKLPIVLYNVPGRTSVNMLPATVARLSKIENIVGIKEASGNLVQVSEIIQSCGTGLRSHFRRRRAYLADIGIGRQRRDFGHCKPGS